jgi:hypothetical protein
MLNGGRKNETTHISLSSASISENLTLFVISQDLLSFPGNNSMKMKLP